MNIEEAIYEKGQIMGIKSDEWIIKMCLDHSMISPFVEEPVRVGVVSYGLSSYGYDIRISNEFKIFTNVNSAIVDPKAFDPNSFVSHVGDECIIPPNSFVLSRTIEKFKIPRNIIGLCIGKSTYARCGLVVNVTALQPEWEGYLTLEISNTTPLPAKIYANEGIAQLVFIEGDGDCKFSYKDRQGKYQGQQEITLPYIEGERNPNTPTEG